MQLSAGRDAALAEMQSGSIMEIICRISDPEVLVIHLPRHYFPAFANHYIPE